MTMIAITGSTPEQRTRFGNRIAKALTCFERATLLCDLSIRLEQLHGPLQVQGKHGLDRVVDLQLEVEQALQHSSDLFLLCGASSTYQSKCDALGSERPGSREKVVASLRRLGAVLFLEGEQTQGDSQEDAGRRDLELAMLRDAGVHFRMIPREWVTWSDEAWKQLAQDCLSNHPNETRKRERQYLVIIGCVENGGKVLFARRRTPILPSADDRWELPGGRVQFGESPHRTIQREMLEETGYLVTAERLLPTVASNIWSRTDGSEEQAIVLCYQCRLLLEAPLFGDPTDPQIQGLCWITPGEWEEERMLNGTLGFLRELYGK